MVYSVQYVGRNGWSGLKSVADDLDEIDEGVPSCDGFRS